MRRAFSIAELMIVVAVIGILAALVVPYFQSQAMEAKEVAAKDNLRTLRGAIMLYAANHGGVAPGYENSNSGGQVHVAHFLSQMVASQGYLRSMPKNPFNDRDTMLILGNGETWPEEAGGDYGWIYQPGTRTICLDWPGADRNGTRYFDY
jgi:prepilin-type N-terminal cleavage/methylation domain-containing protein